MDKPIYTNLENPGKSVVDVVVPPTVQFFFRNLLVPNSKKRMNSSNLNQLKYLIWDLTNNKAVPLDGKDKPQNGIAKTTSKGPDGHTQLIDSIELSNGFWVSTEKVRVPVGHKVGIYINNQVDDRKTHLYEFEVKRNTIILVTEEQDKDVPHYSKTTEEVIDAKNILIKGHLTGQAWLDSTHRYTPEEARKILDKTHYPEYIKTAVVSIYEGRTKLPNESNLKRPHKLIVNYPQSIQLIVDVPEGGGESNYKFFNDAKIAVDSVEVMSRTSPIAYAAVIHSAMKNNFRSVTLNSLWRCIYGSVLHREGRAIDVGKIDGNPVKKKEDAYPPQQKEWDEHKKKEKDAGKKLDDTATEFGQIKALGTIRLKEAKGLPLSDEEQANKDKWTQVETKLLGFSGIRLLRVQLQLDPYVLNLYDPWLIDNTTKDSNAGEANQYKTGLEQLHQHHLHVTVEKVRA